MGVVWMAVWDPSEKRYADCRVETSPLSKPSLQEIQRLAFLLTAYADAKPILYCLENPLDWKRKDLEKESIPSEQEELATVATLLTTSNLEELVFKASVDRDVTIVAWVTSVTDEFLRRVQESKDKHIFDAVTLDVRRYGYWTEADVEENLNGGTITDRQDIADEHLSDFERFLQGPRTYTDIQAKDKRASNYMRELTDQLTGLRGERLTSYFTTSNRQEDSKKREVRDLSEFETVAAVRTASEGAKHDIRALKNVRCSDHISAAFTAIYTQPALRPLTKGEDGNVPLVYRQGTSWDLNLYIRYKHTPDEENAVEKEEYAKYTPKSDFRLDNEYGIPLLLGEIVSDPKKESDRYRLLMQLIAVIRLASKFRENIALMGVYVNEMYIATRYIVQMEGGKINILKKNYDLTIQRQARKFMLQILNYGSYVRSPDAKFEGERASIIRDGIEGIVRDGKVFPSLTSRSNSSKKAGADTSTARLQGTPLPTIQESQGEGSSNEGDR